MLIKFINSEFFDWYDYTEGRIYLTLKNDDNYHKPDWDTIVFYIRRNLLIFGRQTKLAGPLTVIFFISLIVVAWWWGPYMVVSSNWHPLIWVGVAIVIFTTAVTHYDWSEGDVNSRAYLVFLHRIFSIIFIVHILFIYFSLWTIFVSHDGNLIVIAYHGVIYLSVEIFIPCIKMLMYYKELNSALKIFKNELLFIEQNFEMLAFCDQHWLTVRSYHRRSIIDFLVCRVNQLAEAQYHKLIHDFLTILRFQETRLLRYQNIPFYVTIQQAQDSTYYQDEEFGDGRPTAYRQINGLLTIFHSLKRAQ